MNKLQHPLTFQSDSQAVVPTFPAVKTALGEFHSLIVLLPEDMDGSAASQRVRELARAGSMQIQLLSLCKDPARVLSVRRRLVTLASLLDDGRNHVEVNVNLGSNWVDVVRAVYQTGDAIACFAEQRIGLLHRPLHQVLQSNLKATVYVLSNPDPQISKWNTISQLGAWLGFLAIIIGFGLLQAKIIQLPAGWFQSALLILSILPEFASILAWNRRFG
jgi:hypothetical protein